MNPRLSTQRIGRMIGYIVLSLLLLSVLYGVLFSFFTLRNIEVIGTGIELVVDQEKLPRSLLFFPSERTRKELISQNPVLADLKITKRYPSTLVITPTIREPFARLYGKERAVLLDAQGIVLADAGASTIPLPRINVPAEGLRVGQKVTDKSVNQSLTFLSGTKDILSSHEFTSLDGGSIRASTEQLDILFTQDADLSTLIPTLQTLLNGFRIKGTLPAQIDLRFDKPVVTFK